MRGFLRNLEIDVGSQSPCEELGIERYQHYTESKSVLRAPPPRQQPTPLLHLQRRRYSAGQGEGAAVSQLSSRGETVRREEGRGRQTAVREGACMQSSPALFIWNDIISHCWGPGLVMAGLTHEAGQGTHPTRIPEQDRWQPPASRWQDCQVASRMGCELTVFVQVNGYWRKAKPHDSSCRVISHQIRWSAPILESQCVRKKQRSRPPHVIRWEGWKAARGLGSAVCGWPSGLHHLTLFLLHWETGTCCDIWIILQFSKLECRFFPGWLGCMYTELLRGAQKMRW